MSIEVLESTEERRRTSPPVVGRAVVPVPTTRPAPRPVEPARRGGRGYVGTRRAQPGLWQTLRVRGWWRW